MWHRTCARCATGTAAHHTADGTGCDEVNSEHGSLQGTAPRAGRCRGRPRCSTCLTCANESGGGLLDAARRTTLSRRRVQGNIRGRLPARFAMKSMPAHLLFAAADVGGPSHRYSMSWRRDSTRSTRLRCGSLRLKASPPRQPSLADRGGAKWQRGVSVGQLATVCLACLCCAGG
jgi:hypothetical protein